MDSVTGRSWWPMQRTSWICVFTGGGATHVCRGEAREVCARVCVRANTQVGEGRKRRRELTGYLGERLNVCTCVLLPVCLPSCHLTFH